MFRFLHSRSRSWRRGLPAALTAFLTVTLLGPPAQAAPAHHGGWGIYRLVSDNTVARCTNGFNGRTPEGVAVMITAGHCGDKGTVWYSEKDYKTLGTLAQRSFRTDSTANDWAVIRTNGTHDLPGTIVDKGVVRGVARLGTPKVGLAVCMTGRASGTLCGKVTEVRSNGIVRTSIVPAHGDSGSPLFRRIPGLTRVEALGLLSYSDESSYSAFQRLSEVLSSTGNRLATR